MGYFCVMLGSWSTCWFRKGRWRSPVIAWKMEQFTLHTMYEFGAHTQMNHLGSYKGWCEQCLYSSSWQQVDRNGQHLKTGQFAIPTLNGLEANKVNSVTELQGLRRKAEFRFIGASGWELAAAVLPLGVMPVYCKLTPPPPPPPPHPRMYQYLFTAAPTAQCLLTCDIFDKN